MTPDGRLLVFLGLAGVAGAASVRGSRGVVRQGRGVPYNLDAQRRVVADRISASYDFVKEEQRGFVAWGGWSILGDRWTRPVYLRALSSVGKASQTFTFTILFEEGLPELAAEAFVESGSRGVVRRSVPSLNPVDAFTRAEILESAARALFVNAWASEYEESGRSTRGWSGQDLMKIAPSTNERAREMVKEWAGKIEKHHGAPMDVLYERAAAENEREQQGGARHKDPTPEGFGYCLVMQGFGHGVSWTDDHADHGLGRLPYLETSGVDPDLGSDNRGSRGVVRAARRIDTRLQALLERTLLTEPPLVAVTVIAFFAENVARQKASDPILPLGPSSRIPKIPMYAGPLGLLQLRDDAAQLTASANLGPRHLASPEAAVQAVLPYVKNGKWWNGATIPLEEPVPGFVPWLTGQIAAIVKNKAPQKVLDPRRPGSTAKVLLDATTLADIRARVPSWFSIELGEGRASHFATPAEVAMHIRLAVLWDAWSNVTSFARKHPDDWRTLDVKQILAERKKR